MLLYHHCAFIIDNRDKLDDWLHVLLEVPFLQEIVWVMVGHKVLVTVLILHRNKWAVEQFLDVRLLLVIIDQLLMAPLFFLLLLLRLKRLSIFRRRCLQFRLGIFLSTYQLVRPRAFIELVASALVSVQVSVLLAGWFRLMKPFRWYVERFHLILVLELSHHQLPLGFDSLLIPCEVPCFEIGRFVPRHLWSGRD